MPAVSRSQLLAYAVLGLLIAVLGARALRAERPAAAPPPAAVVEGATGAAAGGPGPAAAAWGERGTTAAASPDARAAPDGGTAVGDTPAGAAAVLVHVAGAVRRPGVYRLEAGARVQDAVAQAGGPRRGADVHRLNLAAKVTDGQQLLIPRRGQAASRQAGASPTASAAAPPAGPGAAAGGSAGAPDPGGVVDLNTASVEQLETLDGVGPAIAQKIVAWREANGGFRSVDDLAQVSGIGPKKLEAMRARVAV